MRVLFIAGYNHAVYHRKVELLANVSDFEILHVTIAGYGRDAGQYPSADGKRRYTVQTFSAHYLGRPGDPHRGFLWPPHFDMGRFKPHLIHAESDLEALGTAQVTLARWALAPRSSLIHYSWQNILRPHSWPVRLVSHLSLRSADHVICASNEALSVLRRRGYRRGASVMPLVGLDTRYFYPKPVPALRVRLGLQGVVVGYVGRLVREKGVDILLQAAAQLSVPITLLIVGQGVEKARLQSLAQALGIAERCRFVDAVAYNSVADYMSAMDILVLPSRTTTHWKEQFGRALMEAMGCRVAVVGSNSGAIPEVIGAAGYIFPEGNAEALAVILDKLTADSALLRETRERGYRRVLENYTVERLAEQVLEVWRRVNSASAVLT